MKIINCLGAAIPVMLESGEIRPLKTDGKRPEVNPTDGTVSGLPSEKRGELLLVNFGTYNASKQGNLCMFDPEKTLRKEGEKFAYAQGGVIAKSGEKLGFAVENSEFQ